ncbi:MAG: HEAT repeat domain-containing protein [Planctomycetota bacterium]
MLETLLASLPLLLPQQPPAQPTAPTPQGEATTRTTTDRAAHPDRWLPDTTLAAFVVRPLQPGTDTDRLLGSDDGRGLLGTAAGLVRPLLAEAQLSQDDAAAMLRGGLALGLLGFDRDQLPEMLLVAGVGDAELTLRARLAALPQRSDGLYTLDGGQLRLLLGLREGHLAIGTHATTVTGALEQALQGGAPSLAERQDFAASLPTDGAAVLGHLFVRVDDLAEALFAQMPAQDASTARRIGGIFGLGDMAWASGSWQLQGEELLSRWQLDATHGQGMLLDALLGTAGRLDAGLARFVPADAVGCGFWAVRFGTVFDEVLALATMASPGATEMVDGQLERVRKQTGVDVRADLIGGLGDRVVTFTLPGDGQLGALFELRQGSGFARAIQKLLPLLPLPLEEGTAAGARCWRMPGGQDGPALAVTDDWLMVASSDEAIAAAARQVREPKAAAPVLSFLRSLSPDTTIAILGPVTAPPGPWFDAARAQLADTDLGERRSTVRRTPDGFVAEERAPARSMLRLAQAAIRGVADPMGALAADTGGPQNPNAGDPDAAATLRALATAEPSRLDITTVAAMLSHRDPAIVARACWQLGEWRAKDAVPMLTDLLRGHADADVRLQATAAIARIGGAAGVDALDLAIEDDDQRVRVCAVQAFGKLGKAHATAPLLALLDRFGSERAGGAPPQDVVAALVVLHDIGDPAVLVRAATAVGYSAPQTGQALAFLFQGLSPRLGDQEEGTALLAVLDHPEPMLRRYAVQRLGELRLPQAAKALEGRLAVEGSDLQPLVRVSLAQVRGETDEGADDLVTRAKSNVTAISQMVERRWNRLGTTTKIASASAAAVVVLGLIAFLMARRRSRRRAEAAAAMAMVNPSAGYAASGRNDLEYDEEYEEEDDAFAEVGPNDTEERY